MQESKELLRHWNQALYIPTMIFAAAALMALYKMDIMRYFLYNICFFYAGKLLFSGCIFCVVDSYFQKTPLYYRVDADDRTGADFRLEAEDRMGADDQPEEDDQPGIVSQWNQLITGFINPSEEQKKLNKTLAVIAVLQVAGVMAGIPALVSISAVLVLSAGKALGKEISGW